MDISFSALFVEEIPSGRKETIPEWWDSLMNRCTGSAAYHLLRGKVAETSSV